MVKESAAIWVSLLSEQTSLGIRGDIAEIGVYKGYGASLAGSFLQEGERLVLFDRYFGLEHSIGAIDEVAGRPMSTHIDFHLADSLQLLSEPNALRWKKTRFFHVDGEHSYDAVMNDLELAAKATSIDGCIVVDDVFNFATPQVTHALFDFVRDGRSNLAIFLFAFNKAYLCFNRQLGLYRRTVLLANQACIAAGTLTQVCAGGFAFERTYMSISHAVSEEAFQMIGKFTDDRDVALSPLNRF